MNFSKIDNLLEQIVNYQENNIPAVIAYLEAYEKEHIEALFDENRLPLHAIEFQDLLIKLDILTAFIYKIYNTPELKKQYLTHNDIALKKLLKITFGLYRNICMDITEEDSLGIVYTTIFGILSDKVVELNYCLNRFLQEQLFNIDIEDQVGAFIQDTWNLFLLLIKMIANKKDLDVIELKIQQLQETLESIQKEFLLTEEPDISNGLKISLYANILYVLTEYYHFMIHGKTSQGGRFPDLLDTYIFNAIKFSDLLNDKKNIQMITLVREALYKRYQHSIWSVAEATPTIKRYVVNMIDSKNNLVLNLLPSQREAVVDLLSAKKSIVVNMPTSSGKTLLAQFYILYKMQQHQQGNMIPQVCYVVPTNALINQVKKKLQEEFRGLSLNIETVLPFYNTDELEDEILSNKPIDILITTPEKLDFLIRSKHQALAHLKVIVMDEAHNIADTSRGSKFELLLSVIKQERQDVDFLLMSPFIENAEEIAEWLGESEFDSLGVSTEWTPTKQFIGYYFYNDKSSHVTYLPSGRNDLISEPLNIPLHSSPKVIAHSLGESKPSKYHKIIPLINKYRKVGNVLVLCKSPSSAEENARAMLQYLLHKQMKRIDNDEKVQHAIDIIRLQREGHEFLIQCLSYGIAYHHAQMSDIVKMTVEELMKNNQVNILFATTTLAQGMNFPVTSVIFESYMRKNYAKKSTKLPASEFWNIAGRAGRAFIDSEGHVLLAKYSNSLTEEVLRADTINYIHDDVKNIVSSLEDFFDKINESTVFNTELLNNSPAATNFLQYLNHIVRVIHDYNFDIDPSAINGILNNSLIYRQQSIQKGFMQSQDKIRQFAQKYINHLKGKRISDLTLADQSGISDISLTRLYAEYLNFIEMLKQEGLNIDQNKKVSELVLNTQDHNVLSRVIAILNKVPEFKLEFGSKGKDFSPELIAKMIIQWVNGESIEAIATSNFSKRHANSYEEFLSLCNKYINSPMKNFVPWGVSVFQTISNDREHEVAANLPSFIYYGVNDIESAILSKIGIPRSTVNVVKQAMTHEHKEIAISVENMDKIKSIVKNWDDTIFNKYGENGEAHYYLTQASLS